MKMKKDSINKIKLDIVALGIAIFARIFFIGETRKLSALHLE